MKKGTPILAVLLALLAPSVAAAEDSTVTESPPSTGLGQLITGSVLTGFGALNLATAPLCKTSLMPQSIQDPCFDFSLGFGIAFVAAGVPLLVVGANKRASYNDWRKAHPVISGLFGAPAPGAGLVLGWSAQY